MRQQTTAPGRTPSALPITAAVCLLLAACGGGDDDTAPEPVPPPASHTAAQNPTQTIRAVATTATTATTNTVLVGVRVQGHPHKVDVYRPAGATTAIVFLHGQGGRSGQLAYELGFNRTMGAPTAKTVNWDWLVRNKIIAVFPQGQIAPGATLAAWNNFVSESGQDDVAFLQALSVHVKAQYGATAVSLSGHSSGGAMTARMWCEGTTSYKAFVSLAGPMAAATYPLPGPACTPLAPAPYGIVVGGKDSKLIQFVTGAGTPSAAQIAAGLTDAILVSEWVRHQSRSLAVCGETPLLEAASESPAGPTGNNCGGRVRYTIVSKADHPIASLEQHAGSKMVDVIAAFSK